MFGKIIKYEINKIGLPYVIIRGNNKVTYYCDNRGIDDGNIEDLTVGTYVEFTSLKERNGKIIAAHVKTCNAIENKHVNDTVTLTDEEKLRIRSIIVGYVKKSGRIYLSKLNAFLLSINIDYHTYGYKKPKAFFKDNFSDILIFSEENINGCPQMKIEINSNKQEVDNDIQQKYEEFNKFYESEDYDSALRSELIVTISPDKMPYTYIVKAIDSARKIIGITSELSLSEFDKKIITAPISTGLFIMKKDSDFMKQGQDECFKECNAKVFQNYFNSLIETHTCNTTYLAIAKRFQACFNELYIPIYVLAAYTSKKVNVIDEFLKFTLANSAFECFNLFHKIAKNTIFENDDIPQDYITKVLSISLDADRFELFTEFAELVLDDIPSFVRWVDDPIVRYDEISEMLDGRLSKKVVQKYINYYLYKRLNDGTLNFEMIRLLSEISYNYPISYLEEILSNNSYVAFNKVYKKDLLVRNFNKIIENINVNNKTYILACYVVNNFFSDEVKNYDSFTLTARSLIKEVVDKIKTKPFEIYNVYPLFKVDPDGKRIVEEAFCDYIDKEYEKELSVDNCLKIIKEFNNHTCYFATVHLIETRINRDELLSNQTISSLYITTLKNTANYAKAIKYVKSSNESAITKSAEIIRILYMNFKEFGVSSHAYEIFDDDFTLDVAETLALDKFLPTNGTPIILMAIYKKKKDWVRVYYLYAIYYKLTKTGNLTFYSQLHKTNGKISSMDSHYKAIRLAFVNYSYDDIIDFIHWTSRISIDRRYSGKFEICKSELDHIIKNPNNKQAWENMIFKLAKDSVRQISSAFGYSVQCVYLFWFYDLKKEEDFKKVNDLLEQLMYFASFSKVSDSTNFLSLNAKLIEVMPETYAVKFGVFFNQNKELFAQNEEILSEDIEDLYQLLLQKYNSTYKEIYLELAIELYSTFSIKIPPHFELYKGFCQSSGQKILIFRMMFKLYSTTLSRVFHDFIYYNYWNCSDEENLVLELLKILYSSEGDDLPVDIAVLPTRLLQRFKNDVAMLLEEYPEIHRYNTFIKSDETLGYKYLVLKYVINIAFDQNIYWDISDRYFDFCDQKKVWYDLAAEDIDGIKSCLEYFKVCYAKQCKYVQYLGVEYISRRYINLLLIDVYFNLISGSKNTEVKDDYIVDLMRENNHISLVLDKYYKKFRDELRIFTDLFLSFETKSLLLLSIIRGSLCSLAKFPNAIDEILKDPDSYLSIKEIIKMTGYPSVSQSALYLFFNIVEVHERIMEFSRLVLPNAYKVMVLYQELNESDDNEAMLEFLKYAYTETNHKQFLLTLIKNKNGFLDADKYLKYKDILIHITIATLFNYNIIRDIGNLVRGGKIVLPHSFFYDLLKEMNNEDVYWYLFALQSALRNNKDEALAFFYRVKSKSNIPGLWEKEYESLEKYVKGEIQNFTTVRYYNNFNAFTEISIRKTQLFEIAKRVFTDSSDISMAKSSLRLFVDENSTSQEKIRAGSIILTCIENEGSKFYSFKQSDDEEKTITYNEFLFEYGLLMIKSRYITVDEKLSIILELFDCFESLNDRNRAKFKERLKNSFVDLLVNIKTEDEIISYNSWLISQSKIDEIIVRHKIHIDGIDFLNNLLGSCVEFENNDYTVMEKIEFLNSLPVDISVSDVTRNFLNSVQKELDRLQKGVMAQILIINTDIEDDSIFIIVENLKNSKISIDLTKKSNVALFKVSLTNKRTGKSLCFDSFCSGNVEILRPSYVSGERIVLPDYIKSDLIEGDLLTINITFNVNGVKICNNNNQKRNFKYCIFKDSDKIKKPIQKYNTRSCAFRPDNIGFGRTTDKEWLDKFIPTNGLSVIYGPSRVGKSSLMEYITNFLSRDFKHKSRQFATNADPLDVLYVVSHEEDYYKFPESDVERLEFLFIKPIKSTLNIIKETEMIESADVDGDNLSRETIEQILELLDKSNLSIEQKLKTVSKILSGQNAEIWVLIDEFQQVVKKWNITHNELFKDLCKHLLENIDCIRFVVCGADELVKLMINQDPVIYNEKRWCVGQFAEKDEHDYAAMLCDSQVWGDNGHPYTDEALSYIFSYTGGNAMYGKLIGNRLIDLIEQDEFVHRKKIYPYDISSIITKMLFDQKNDLGAKDIVNEFIANVTENLELENRYLVYIAYVMMSNPNCTSVTFSEICDYFAQTEERVISTALELCSVRGILFTTEIDGENAYKFSTTFYYSQYCEIVKRNSLPKREYANPSDEAVDTLEMELTDPQDISNKIIDLWRSLGKVDSHNPAKASETEKIKEHIGTVINAKQVNTQGGNGKLDEGGNTYNNIIINAQIINTAFTTLLNPFATDSNLLAAFRNLPRLTSYIVEEHDELKLLASSLQSKYEEYEKCFDEEGICIDEHKLRLIAEDIYDKQNKIESLSQPAEHKMLSDTMGAIAGSDDFMYVNDQRWIELLHVDREIIKKLRDLPFEFTMPLSFAVALHNVFDNIYASINEKKKAGRLNSVEITAEQLDYCPVAIMYCKIIESMLKKCHTPIYIERLGNKSLKLGGKTIYSQLGTPECFNERHKELSIGSFVSHLVFLSKKKISLNHPIKKPSEQDFYFGVMRVRDNIEDYDANICALIKDKYFEDKIKRDWKSHAMALKIVHEIRNKSAHEAVLITKECFDWLIETLFTNGELLRIWDLSKKSSI